MTLDKYINNLEDIGVGKDLENEKIIFSERVDVKTIWKYNVGSTEKYEIRKYVLPNNEKILRYLDSEEIDSIKYSKHIASLVDMRAVKNIITN